MQPVACIMGAQIFQKIYEPPQNSSRYKGDMKLGLS